MDFFFLDTNILDSWSPEAGRLPGFDVGNRPVTVFFWGGGALSSSCKGSYGALISTVKFHPSYLFIYGHLLGL